MVNPKELRSLQFFNEMSDDELDVLSEIINKKDFASGETIFNESEEGHSLYIIKKGEIKVCKVGPDGELLTLTVLKDDDIFGEMSFLDERTHSSTIIAISDIETFVLEKPDFEGLVDTHPRIVYKALRNIIFTIHAIVKGMNMRYTEMMNYMWGRRR